MRKRYSYCAALSLFEFPSFSSKRITCVKCLFEWWLSKTRLLLYHGFVMLLLSMRHFLSNPSPNRYCAYQCIPLFSQLHPYWVHPRTNIGAARLQGNWNKTTRQFDGPPFPFVKIKQLFCECCTYPLPHLLPSDLVKTKIKPILFERAVTVFFRK